MGLINRRPPLQADEQIRWRSGAILANGRNVNTQVAGTLYVTTFGLLFMPNRLNLPNVKGRKAASRISLEDISAIDIKERDSRTPYTNGQRRRVRVQRRDGQCDLFLMGQPDKIVAEMRSVLDIPQPEAPAWSDPSRASALID